MLSVSIIYCLNLSSVCIYFVSPPYGRHSILCYVQFYVMKLAQVSLTEFWLSFVCFHVYVVSHARVRSQGRHSSASQNLLTVKLVLSQLAKHVFN